MRTLLTLLLLAAPLAHAQAVVVDRIVATVDSRAITRSELEERMKRGKLTRNEALNELVEEYLITKDAIAKSITVSDEEVERAIGEVKKSNNIDDPTFDAALKAQGYTLQQYRTSIGLQLLQMRWLMIRTSSLERPAEPEKRDAFMEAQKKKLVTELRSKAAITQGAP
ncbi:MAG: SurA N-terminal domain-containing protein [Archangium sp.]